MSPSSQYYFEANRAIIVNKLKYGYFVTLSDFDKISITMPARRWNQLFKYEKEIDESLAKKDVKFREHIGSGYYVCVTSPYKCVQVRKFYYHADDKEERPTKKGFTFKLAEWERVKVISERIKQDYQEVADEAVCSAGSDHYNQLGYIACFECNPFRHFV